MTSEEKKVIEFLVQDVKKHQKSHVDELETPSFDEVYQIGPNRTEPAYKQAVEYARAYCTFYSNKDVRTVRTLARKLVSLSEIKPQIAQMLSEAHEPDFVLNIRRALEGIVYEQMIETGDELKKAPLYTDAEGVQLENYEPGQWQIVFNETEFSNIDTYYKLFNDQYLWVKLSKSAIENNAKTLIGPLTAHISLFELALKIDAQYPFAQVVNDEKAIVIGAGGASRAVCAMLVRYGATQVYLINRSIDKAQDIAGMAEKIVPLGLTEGNDIGTYKDIPDGEYLAFQCTSLGLKEGDKLLIEDEDFYNKISYGYDLIYNPSETPFTKMLKRIGVPYNNGLTMLLFQAVIAYELWFNVTVPESVSEAARRNLFRAVYKESDNIVLTGYMGSGKSSVGKALAEKLGRTYIDVDEYIVEEQKKSIPQIFEESGEEGFRKIETQALQKLYDTYFGNAVIATGGGAVLRKENRDILQDLGNVFYLYADPKTTFERVKGDTNRPLLSSSDEEEMKNKIVTMIGQRRGYYEMTADYTIDTNSKNVSESADNIIEKM